MTDLQLVESCRNVAIGTARALRGGLIMCRPPNDPGEAPVRSYYAQIAREVASVEGPWCILSDTSHITNLPGASERRLHGQLMNAVDPALCAGTVVVVPNALVRNVVTGILWLSRQQVPTRTAADLAQGVADACAMLEAARTSSRGS